MKKLIKQISFQQTKNKNSLKQKIHKKNKNIYRKKKKKKQKKKRKKKKQGVYNQ